MKPIALLLILTFPVAILFANDSEYGAESQEKLLEMIQTAVAEEKKELYLKATCWERLNEKLRKRFEASSPIFVSKKAEKIELVENGDDPYGAFEGFEYNVEYRGYIALHYSDKEEPVKAPYGFHKGRFYLATLMKAGTFAD